MRYIHIVCELYVKYMCTKCDLYTSFDYWELFVLYILYNFILFIVYSFIASLFIINKHLFYYLYKKIQILSISKTIILKIPQ